MVTRTAASFATALPITVENLCGIVIVIELADGQFAGYFHLQPGSVRVKHESRMQSGQFLRRVENSGDSREHH